MEDYSTVKGASKDSFIEKKSEFIGHIFHAETEEEAVAFINNIRAQHRKATHNVYAYILRDGNTARYSDDGEPQGTAGIPVLDVLQKEGVTDVCCVVTRYFGGILLGGGGLVRAYSHAAKIALDSAERMIMCSAYPAEIKMDYDLYNKISYILPEFEVKLLDTDFGADVRISLLVKKAMFEPMKEKLVDCSNGRVSIVHGDETFEDFA